MSERQQPCGSPSCSEVGRCGGGFEVRQIFKRIDSGEVLNDSDGGIAIPLRVYALFFQRFVEGEDALLELCKTARSGVLDIVEAI